MRIMNTDKIVKDTKSIILVALLVGIILLGLGLTFGFLEGDLQKYSKGIVGLSFLPLSVSFVSYIKLKMIRNNPGKMKDMIIEDTDERILSLRNESDAKAFRIVQGAIFLSYMGYTLLVPGDIFEAIGWWILLVLCLTTFISQGVISHLANKANNSDSE
jgi:hypothetical protein